MEALSLVCNIIQLADGAHKAFLAVKSLHDNGGPDAGLGTHADSLQQLGYELKQSIAARGPPHQLSAADVALHDHATAMARVVGRLQVELGKFKGTKKGRAKDTVRYLLKRRKIEGLEKTLGQLQNIMDSTILVDMRQRMRNDHEHIRLEWNNLDTNLRSFILRQLSVSDNAMVAELEKQSAATRSAILDDGQRTRNKLSTVNQQFSQTIKVESSRVREEVVSESAAIQETVSRGFKRLHIGELAAEVKAFVDSFWFPEMNTRRNASAIEHGAGSFEWIFYPKTNYSELPYDVQIPYREACKLLQWLRNGQELFWVSGKAGSGKSTLMNFLIRDRRTMETLNASHPASRSIILDAFIWNPGAAMQKSAKGVLCTLVHGMLSEDASVAEWLHGSTPQASRKKGPSDWSRKELESVLRRAIERAGCPTCIFIDGLDEVDGTETTQHSMLELIHFIRNLPLVKLCVASRPEPVFKRFLQQYPHIKLQDLTLGDIQKVVGDMLRTQNVLQAGEIDQLVFRVACRADGVFLWVRVVVNSLLRGIANGDDWETIMDRLNDMPSDLTEMYRAMWERLGDDAPRYRQQAGLFFNFMILTVQIPRRKLRHRSFMDMVMAAEPNLRRALLYGEPGTKRAVADELLDICASTRERIGTASAGLLEVEGSGVDLGEYRDATVSFIHRSARDFLRDEGRNILDQGQITRQTVLECFLASDLAFEEPTVNPYHLPFFKMDTAMSWRGVLEDITSDEPLRVLEDCMGVYRKALESLPAWRESNRDVVELLVESGHDAFLDLLALSSVEPVMQTKVSGVRLLTTACSSYGSLAHSPRGFRSVSWVLQNRMVQGAHGFDMDNDSAPGVRLLLLLFIQPAKYRLDSAQVPIVSLKYRDGITRQFFKDCALSNLRCAVFARACYPIDLILTHLQLYDRMGYIDRPNYRIRAIVETSVGVLSRLTFHDWKVSGLLDRSADEDLTRPLVSTVPTHLMIVGLVRFEWEGGSERRARDIKAMRAHHLLRLSHDDIRTDGLPGSSDVTSFTQHLLDSNLERLWETSESEVLDARETVEWLVQEGYMTPGALTLDDPSKALEYGVNLV